MAGPDRKTYGFNRDDAEELIGMIGFSESETPAGHPSGGGNKLFRFTLTSGFTAGTASASIKEMDGTAAGSHDVEDPESIFTDMTTDDTGLCLRQGGVYYVIQASCPV